MVPSLCVYVFGLRFLHSLTSNCLYMDPWWPFAADLGILSRWRCLQSSWIFTPPSVGKAGSSQMHLNDGFRQPLGREAAEVPDVDQWALEKSVLMFPGDLCSIIYATFWVWCSWSRTRLFHISWCLDIINLLISCLLWFPLKVT